MAHLQQHAAPYVCVYIYIYIYIYVHHIIPRNRILHKQINARHRVIYHFRCSRKCGCSPCEYIIKTIRWSWVREIASTINGSSRDIALITTSTRAQQQPKDVMECGPKKALDLLHALPRPGTLATHPPYHAVLTRNLEPESHKPETPNPTPQTALSP